MVRESIIDWGPIINYRRVDTIPVDAKVWKSLRDDRSFHTVITCILIHWVLGWTWNYSFKTFFCRRVDVWNRSCFFRRGGGRANLRNWSETEERNRMNNAMLKVSLVPPPHTQGKVSTHLPAKTTPFPNILGRKISIFYPLAPEKKKHRYIILYQSELLLFSFISRECKSRAILYYVHLTRRIWGGIEQPVKGRETAKNNSNSWTCVIHVVETHKILEIRPWNRSTSVLQLCVRKLKTNTTSYIFPTK